MKSDFEEFISVKIQLDNHNSITIIGVYKSPDTSAENENKLMALLRTASFETPGTVIISGDFNYPGINWLTMDPVTHIEKNSVFLDSIRDCFLTQHVTFPTRARSTQTPSTLDLILTKDDNEIDHLIALSPLGKSDHACLSFTVRSAKPKTLKERKVYFYEKGHYEEMRAELHDYPWPNHETDINALYEHFSTTLTNLREKYVPSKIISGPRKHKPYKLTLDDQKAIKHKHRAWT